MEKSIILSLVLVLCSCIQNSSEVREAKEFYPGGNKLSKGNKLNNLKSGLWSYWHENGKLEEYGAFEYGKKEGEWTSWYSDGTIKNVGSYTNDILNGPFEEYDINGSKITEGKFLNGLKEGEWYQWDEQGNLLAKTTYSLGNLDGNLELYYANGKLAGQGIYKNGLLVGNWMSWYPNGQNSLLIEALDEGQLYINVWDTLGNYQVENGNGKFVYKLPYGEIKIIGEVKDMKPVGTWLYLDANNEIMFEDSLSYNIINN